MKIKAQSNVDISLSQDLYGKRSQDPYALVYLLADNGSTYFQDGNEKTITFDKTLDPPFKTKFEFKVSKYTIMTVTKL